MNREAIGTIVIALCCLLALGAASTTIDSAVETDPDEVINMDVLSLPIGTQTAIELKAEIEGESESPDTTDGSKPQSDDMSSESGPSDAESKSSPTDQNAADSAASHGTADRGADRFTDALRDDQDFFTEMLEALRSLVSMLLSIMPYLLFLTGLALVIANRERLWKLLDRGPTGVPRIEPFIGVGERQSPGPDNSIEQMWLDMVTLLDLDDLGSKTPREYAIEAVNAGADRDGIEQLTTVFEEVRYGEAPVTDDRRHKARHAFERIRAAQRRGNRL